MNSRVHILQQGKEQILHIPQEFALEGQEVQIYRDGNKLVIEPIKKIGLKALLNQWDDLDEDFPEIIDLPLNSQSVF